jgi:hypothetical protein
MRNKPHQNAQKRSIIGKYSSSLEWRPSVGVVF